MAREREAAARSAAREASKSANTRERLAALEARALRASAELAEDPPPAARCGPSSAVATPTPPESPSEQHDGPQRAVQYEAKRGRAKRAAAREAADQRWRKRFEQDLAGQHGPPTMSRDVWVMAQQIVSTPGNRAVHFWLRFCRSRFSGMPLARLREAALQPQPDGTCKYDWGDMSARRVLALGLIELRMSRVATAQQVYGSRSQKVGRVLRGVSKQCLIAAVTPRWRSRRWHRNTLGGRTDKWKGDFARLERAGFFVRKRLPTARLRPWEIGSQSGQAITRYWIPCVPSLARAKTPRRAAPSQLGDALDAFEGSSFVGADHELGWNLCDEKIVRTPRARGQPP